ncbi:MAG TPA: beta-L-arabinofuranosidase domain-containing protein [Rectinemataceae bacterium]|nr:beta-L-arabinofuranosidase domain-containing protein [Rectinemataceae bacterium]
MESTSPLSPKSVLISGGFWKVKQDLVATQVIPYQWKALNDEIPGAEPSHSVENFRIAAGLEKGEFYGLIFQDSDIGKWIEAAAYSLMSRPDPGLEAKIDSVVEIIAKAQEADGYLQTYFTVKAREKRYTDFALGHEMYCGGHLMEGAVAYFQATGKRSFLDVMCRYADHLVRSFGRGPGQMVAYDGHPEIELALIRLYGVTGEEKYRDLSRFFVDERGKHPAVLDPKKIIAWPYEPSLWNGPDYYLDHAPVREQRKVTGHSVRAMYLYAAMADQRRLDGDDSLEPALEALWQNLVSSHMYITGGIGSQSMGERFTIDDDLPSDRAYTETCAAIGLVLWAWRMTLADPDSRYADVLERALYNGSLSGISLDGKRYFYVNPLEVIPSVAEYRQDQAHVKTGRVEWFGCACCPPNIARTIASFSQYQYSATDTSLWAHQFAEGRARIPLRGGFLEIVQRGDFPWDGLVSFTMEAVPDAEAWSFYLRIPSWCSRPALRVNGQVFPTDRREKGYVAIARTWKAGDIVALTLPMEVQFVRSHPRVRETFGKVAVQRGPLIFCAEEIDNGPDLHSLSLLTREKARVEEAQDLGPGVRRLRLKAIRSSAKPLMDTYSTESPSERSVEAVLVPYHLWGNRGKGEMRVWLEARSF